MRHLSLVFLFAFFLLPARVFSQSEIWAKTSGGTGDDEADVLCIDAQGNLFVSGFFKSPSITIGDKVLKNKGNNTSDIYLMKYDPSGKLLWAKSAGGERDEEVLGIFVDAAGNVCLRGYFESSTIVFDGVTLKNNTDDISMFLVKCDPSGKVLWGRSAEAFASGHAVDAQGNIFLSGELLGKVKTNFGDGEFTPSDNGIFVVKYNSEGKVQWVKKGTGAEPYAISVDAQGNAYLSGMITGLACIMEGAPKMINAGEEKSTDMFFMKIAADGKIAWQKLIGGKGNEEPRGQFVNSSGNSYVVLRFTSIALNLGKEDHKNGGGDDLLLIKFDSNGAITWSKNAGGNGHDNPIFLVTDPQENIYIVGHYYSSQITFDHLTLNNVGATDIFIVKFSPDGKVNWAKTTGGSHHDYPNGLVADQSSNIYLIGEFNSSATKDKVTSEFFMEKYDTAGNTVWKSSEHRSESFDFAFGESIDKAGNLYMVGYYGGNLKFGGSDYKSNGGKDMFILKYNINNAKEKTQTAQTPGKTPVKTNKKK